MIRFKENAPCFKWIVRCGFLLLLIFQSTFSPRKLKVKPQFVPQTLVCLHCKYLFGISWVFFFLLSSHSLGNLLRTKTKKKGRKEHSSLEKFLNLTYYMLLCTSGQIFYRYWIHFDMYRSIRKWFTHINLLVVFCFPASSSPKRKSKWNEIIRYINRFSVYSSL